MSRQQTRSSGDGAIDPSLVQKKRARHRLVGAVCLCLVAAAVVPMVLESEPRPRRDVPLEIAGSSKPAAQPSAAPAGAGDVAGSAPAPDNAPATSQSAVRTITPPALSAAPGGPAGAGAPSVSPRDPIPLPKTDGATDTKATARADTRAERADARAAPTTAAKPESKAESRPDAKALAKAEPKNESRAESKGDPKSDSRSDARAESKTAAGAAPARSAEPDVLARLIDRATQSSSAAKPEESASRGGSGTATASAASRRFLVQIGAFSNVQSARNVSDRAVQAGLRPYQETVKTSQGDWIRVRIGPFSSREDAERAQQDLKRAGVTAAIIAL